MINRAPSRAIASTGSSRSPTPASNSSSSRRNRSLGTIFAMRAYLQRFVVSGQKRRLRPHYVPPVSGTAPHDLVLRADGLGVVALPPAARRLDVPGVGI